MTELDTRGKPLPDYPHALKLDGFNKYRYHLVMVLITSALVAYFFGWLSTFLYVFGVMQTFLFFHREGRT